MEEEEEEEDSELVLIDDNIIVKNAAKNRVADQGKNQESVPVTNLSESKKRQRNNDDTEKECDPISESSTGAVSSWIPTTEGGKLYAIGVGFAFLVVLQIVLVISFS